MSRTYTSLLSPIQIGDITVKNRIHMAPMTRNRALDTYPTELMKDFFVQRANAGLIVTDGVLITRQGTEWPHAPGIWDAKHIVDWKDIVDGVHAAGGTIYAQLWHVGRAAHPQTAQQKLANSPVYAPSAIRARGGKFRELPGAPEYTTPTAVDDPWTIIRQFKQAAINAKEAGFDGVELHGAGGYLVHQFLDNTSNQRTDQWGGSIENRSRFGLEILKNLKEVYGANVAIKLSPCGGMNDIGMPLQETLDTFSYFVTEADKLKLAYITLMRYATMLDFKIDGVLRATQHDVLASYGPLIKNSKIIVNVGVTADEGEKLVSSGKADAITIGLSWISHPDLAKRIEHGKPLDNALDFSHLYPDGSPGETWKVGYTDYPAAVY